MLQKCFTTWTFSCVLIDISPFNHIGSCSANRTILESLYSGHSTPWINYCCCLNKSWGDESTPSAVACLHQRGALVEISQLHGCEPPLFGQIRHGSDRALVVARQKDDPAAALDDLVGSQGGRNQVIKTFHQLRACERLRNEDRGREAIQFFEGNAERVCRIDDRLAFPTRQGFRYVAMLFEQDRQDDCVGLERLLQ